MNSLKIQHLVFNKIYLRMPLSGIKVLEFCTYSQGVQFCGRILADFGATVTQIQMVGIF